MSAATSFPIRLLNINLYSAKHLDKERVNVFHSYIMYTTHWWMDLGVTHMASSTAFIPSAHSP